MSLRRGASLLLGVLAAAALTLGARGQPQGGGFPHARHAGLFPVCTGCHEGIATGDSARFFPAPSLCARCHNGTIRPRVAWSGSRPLPANVVFSHQAHDSATTAAGQTTDCLRCHATAAPQAPAAPARPSTVRMAVVRARPDLCITCHAHEAPAHLALSARCRLCHAPIAGIGGVPRDTIAAFPRPATHAAADFILTHGRGTTVEVAEARCAVCHARQSCQRCHVNAERVPPIAALQPDERVAAIVAGLEPVWPEPRNHRSADWLREHGAMATAQAATCANCHTQPGCRSCHIGQGANPVIALLPTPRPGGPAGVLVARSGAGGLAGGVPAAPGAGPPLAEVPAAAAVAPPSRNRVHPAGFATNHGAEAGTGDPNCTACHQRSFCVQCHEGSTRPVFHPPAYLARHAADAYAAATDCESCHNTATFCRACHQGAGLRAQGRTDVAFHTGQPVWLLQHGQAAREDLQACATCHAQQTCLRCHSTLTQRVNPHGPGFDAARMEKKSPIMCLRCHLTLPVTQ